MKISDKDLENSLILNRGKVSQIAKDFGTSRMALYKRIKKNIHLTCILDSFKGRSTPEDLPQTRLKEIDNSESPIDKPKLFSKSDLLNRYKNKMEFVEKLIDKAEEKLDVLVENNDKQAIMFVLKTQGRGRGWSENEPLPNINKDIKITFNMKKNEEKEKEIENNIIDVTNKDKSE